MNERVYLYLLKNCLGNPTKVDTICQALGISEREWRRARNYINKHKKSKVAYNQKGVWLVDKKSDLERYRKTRIAVLKNVVQEIQSLDRALNNNNQVTFTDNGLKIDIKLG